MYAMNYVLRGSGACEALILLNFLPFLPPEGMQERMKEIQDKQITFGRLCVTHRWISRLLASFP